MAFLDIIVPQFKEDEKVIKGLLDSIERQKNIDFNDIRILIIGDIKGYKLSKIFIKGYRKLNIEYLIPESHNTQGMAEQYGLDKSDGIYVTFIDSDDEFYGDSSLCEIIYGLKNTNINLLCTSMDQENMKNGRIFHSKVSFNVLRTLHGVFVKRQYLIDNDIKFNERLNFFEDTYFVTCLTARNDMTIIDNITYVWKWNDMSKSLAKNKYDVSVRHYLDIMHAHMDIYDYFVTHNILNSDKYIIQQIIELAYILESSYFDFPELEEQRKEYEGLLYNLYLEHKDKFDKLSNNEKNAYYDFVKRDVSAYYVGIVLKDNLDDFVNKMKLN